MVQLERTNVRSTCNCLEFETIKIEEQGMLCVLTPYAKMGGKEDFNYEEK